MPQLFVGTSGWAYPSWKPDFYPAKLAQKKFLSHYATQFNTVEVNFTFRQLVKETTIQNWIQETPAHFRLGIKAHQVITHIKRLEGDGRFCSALSGDDRAAGRGGQAGAGALPVAAKSESGRRAAQGFSCAPAAHVAGGIRIPSRLLVRRLDLGNFEVARGRAVRGRDRRTHDAGCGHGDRLSTTDSASRITRRTSAAAWSRASGNIWLPDATSSLTSSMKRRRRELCSRWTMLREAGQT